MVNLNQIGFGLMGAGMYVASTSAMPDGIAVNLSPAGVPPAAKLLAGTAMITLGGVMTFLQLPK